MELRYANQNVEFRGLHGHPASSSNALKSKADYFEQFFTTGFEIDDIKMDMHQQDVASHATVYAHRLTQQWG